MKLHSILSLKAKYKTTGPEHSWFLGWYRIFFVYFPPSNQEWPRKLNLKKKRAYVDLFKMYHQLKQVGLTADISTHVYKSNGIHSVRWLVLMWGNIQRWWRKATQEPPWTSRKSKLFLAGLIRPKHKCW